MRILFWATAATVSFCPVLPVKFLTGWLRTKGGLRASEPAPWSYLTVAARVLLDDLGDHARADGAAAFADGEAQAGIHGDGLDHLDLHLHVVARHDHLGPLGQLRDAGDVGRAEVELRPVPVDERGVRGDRSRLAEHLPALDLLALDASQEAADVVAGTALVEDLAEHLDTRDDGVGG